MIRILNIEYTYSRQEVKHLNERNRLSSQVWILPSGCREQGQGAVPAPADCGPDACIEVRKEAGVAPVLMVGNGTSLSSETCLMTDIGS